MLPTAIGSIFDLTHDKIEFYTNRLRPHDNHQGHWGCSSVSGFISNDDDLMACATKDLSTLKEKKVTYLAIANKLEMLFRLALESPSGFAYEGNVKITHSQPTLCAQFCPFSVVSDDNASPFSKIHDACSQDNMEFTIVNTLKNRSIVVSGLLAHLIKEHHFFEGHVQYRASPEDLIEILEIEPEANFSSPITPLIPKVIKPVIKKVPTWRFGGSYPCTSPLIPINLAKKYNIKLYDLRKDIVGLILPYQYGFDEDYEPFMSSFLPKHDYLHLFNSGKSTQKISGNINDLSFSDIEVFSGRRIILLSSDLL